MRLIFKEKNMKKILLVMVLFALAASGAFAQVALDSHLSFAMATGGSNINIGFAPSLGVNIGLGALDIIIGTDFTLNAHRSNVGGNPIGKRKDWALGIYGGVAPQLAESGNLRLTLPLLAKMTYNAYRNSNSANDDFNRFGWMSFDFAAGPRAYYAFSPKWSGYLGFEMTVMGFEGKGKGKAKVGGTTSTGDGNETDFYIFPGGSIDLGIKITF